MTWLHKRNCSIQWKECKYDKKINGGQCGSVWKLPKGPPDDALVKVNQTRGQKRSVGSPQFPCWRSLYRINCWGFHGVFCDPCAGFNMALASWTGKKNHPCKPSWSTLWSRKSCIGVMMCSTPQLQIFYMKLSKSYMNRTKRSSTLLWKNIKPCTLGGEIHPVSTTLEHLLFTKRRNQGWEYRAQSVGCISKAVPSPNFIQTSSIKSDISFRI